MVGLKDVAEHLRELDRQFVHQRDNHWAQMAEVVEKTIAWMDDDDRDIVIDDLVSKVDRMQAALIAIANDRNEFEGPSLDYMQGYRDGQEHLAKMAREATSRLDAMTVKRWEDIPPIEPLLEAIADLPSP